LDRKVVFVVDDELPIAQTLALILESKGYASFAFLHPLDALKSLPELGSPDLLITDFKMPDMDGLTLASTMTEICPKCKVLILTGAPQLMESHPDRGKFDCLFKPVPIPVLLEAVAEMLVDSGMTWAAA
jgi:DNA-binding NtrC family response regulator